MSDDERGPGARIVVIDDPYPASFPSLRRQVTPEQVLAIHRIADELRATRALDAPRFQVGDLLAGLDRSGFDLVPSKVTSVGATRLVVGPVAPDPPETAASRRLRLWLFVALAPRWGRR